MSTEIPAPSIDFLAIGPEVVLAAGACLVLLIRAAGARSRRDRIAKSSAAVAAFAATAASAVLAAAALSKAHTSGASTTLGHMIALDTYSASFKILIAAMAAMALIMGYGGLAADGSSREEFGALTLLASVGMMVMVSSVDLIVIFLALELFSVSFYILAGFLRERPAPQEAALKYFLLGSFASAFFLYGVALSYGGAGSLNLEIISAVTSRGDFSLLILGGIALILAGLGFKVGAVPFHMWVPDVYQGTPSYLAGFLAAGAKVAGFGAALRIFSSLISSKEVWLPLIVTVGVVTMAVGAVGAIGQANVKRMLGYSSIVHAGYLFLGVAAPGPRGSAAGLFYLVTYAAMIFGAFAIIAVFQKGRPESGDLEDFRGMGRRRPLLGVSLTVLLLALAGVPPTSGFIAKFYLFRAALDAGLWWFALAGALASVAAAFFYIRLIVIMYSTADKESSTLSISAKAPISLTAGIAAAVALTMAVGIFPQPLLAFAENAGLIGGL